MMVTEQKQNNWMLFYEYLKLNCSCNRDESNNYLILLLCGTQKKCDSNNEEKKPHK